MKKSILRQGTTLLMLLLALLLFAGVNSVSAQEADEETEATETVTIVYDSNPDEELGTFPVIPFDELILLDGTGKLVTHLRIMRSALAGAKAGVADDCLVFTATYDTIKDESVFFAPDTVPENYNESYTLYVWSFIFGLDRTRSAYFGCQNDGRVNNFDHDVAYSALNNAIDTGERALMLTETLVGDVVEEVEEDDGIDDVPPVEEEDTDSPISGDAMTVRWTNLYSEPDSTTATGDAIPPMTPVDVVMMDNAWAQIESEFGDGFVPRNALDIEMFPTPIDDDEEMDDGDVDDGEMDDGDMDDEEIDDSDEATDFEQAVAEAVTAFYIEWDGETRDPRVIQDLVDLADEDLIRPAVVEFDAEAFFLVQFISAGSADVIRAALAPSDPDCDAIVDAYTLLALSPEFTNVPEEAQSLVNRYESIVSEVLDATKDLMLTCLNDGQLTDLNRSIALSGAEAAYDAFLEVAAGASLLL